MKDYCIKDDDPQPQAGSQNRKIYMSIARLMTKHLKKCLCELEIETDSMCQWCNKKST